MDAKQLLIATAATLGLSTSALAASSVTYSFSQSGFASGGTVTGFFSGTDTDGDGQLYAASQFASDITGVPFGNELEYAEVTMTGFFPEPVTLVYDASVADMTDISNAFMAISYNLDGGSFGDEADEGLSFAFFAPSSNYLLGEAFAFYWTDPLVNTTFDSCGGDEVCSAFVNFVPADNPSGIKPVYLDTSSALVDVQAVPVPAAAWLMVSGLGLLGATGARRRDRGVATA